MSTENTNGDGAPQNSQSPTTGSEPASTGYTPVALGQPAAYMPPPQPAALPAKSGGGALKIILIIVAVFVGLGILGLGAIGYTAWRITRAVHVSGPGGEVSVNGPNGSISVNQAKSYSAAELGTDIYPGATAAEGSMKMDLPTGSMVTGVFVTSDSKDKVVDFYKSKFGSEVSVMDTANGAFMTLKKSEQEAIMVTVTANESRSEGKTRISIVHTVTKKAS